MDPTDFRGPERTRLAHALAPLFGELLDDHLAEISQRSQRIELSAGDFLLRQGESSNALYIVLHGRLHVEHQNTTGRSDAVGELASGDLIGEESLLTGEPHDATICAMRDSVLLRFSHATFVEYLHTHPTVIWGMTRTVLRRTREARAGRRPRTAIRILAVQFIHEGIDRPAVLDRLRRALALHGPATVVDSSMARENGDPKRERARFAHWLDELEDANRFVLLALDDEAEAWSHSCVRQADRLLLVGRANGDPAIGVVERSLREEMPEVARATTSLLLLHDDDRAHPRNSAAWFEGRELLRHHHIVHDRARDFERVARFLAHRAIGLVLAGGGAKAFVHLGVYQALEEAHVPPTMSTGTCSQPRPPSLP